MYSKKVIDHFTNPRNHGEIPDHDGLGKVGNPTCGDIMWMYIKVDDKDIISDIKFKTFGCASAIATSSMTTELAKRKKIKAAYKITRDNIANALDGLPQVKMHCSNLGADALHKAIENFLEKKGRSLDEIDE